MVKKLNPDEGTINTRDPFGQPPDIKLNHRQALHIVKKTMFILTSLILFICLGAGILYYAFREQVESEEAIASQSIADISMALIHAHMHHSLPPNQNWYDANFLKDNLESILPPSHTIPCHIDPQGQFESCPYILRIYANNTQSRFLLIAQPSPSLIQWLIPKAAIVVDSQAMELRQITDLKTLNRLLINSNTFDDINENELSSLVKQGTIVSLDTLNKQNHNAQFLPPIEPNLKQSEISTPVYNAPRYHKIDQPLIGLSIKINELNNNDQYLTNKQEFERLLLLMPHKILYVTNNIEEAIQMEKALQSLGKEKAFPLIHLTLNQEGNVTSHLLLNQMKETRSQQPGLEVASTTPPKEDLIDNDHPLFVTLLELAKSRQEAFTPITKEINDLLSQNAATSIPEAGTRLQKLTKDYEKINNEQKTRIAKSLSLLYRDFVVNNGMDSSTFTQYLKNTGIVDSSSSISTKGK
jgi:hypothetical protein